jgi:CBS domain-containing membrane protein
MSMPTMLARLRDLVPEPATVGFRERVRSAAGALIGVLATGLLSLAALGDGSTLPILIAPMGASAVLLFAVPASPLAQPWSILGGNVVAALIGVTAAKALPDPFFAAALAIGCAIALMMALRCLHPPSGAVALTAVLGGPAITELGYGFVLWPVAANSLLLLTTALLFNNLTGRSYPHARPRPPVDHRTSDPAPAARIGFTTEDLDAALRDFGQMIDIGRGDLETLLREAQRRALTRRSGPTTCADIMSRDVIAIAPEAGLVEALRLLRRHHIKVLPVTDESARVLGIVTQTDLLDKAEWGRLGPRLGLRHRLALTLSRIRAPHGAVEDIMTTHVKTARPDTSLVDLAAQMSDAGVHHLPVVGTDEKLAGIVSQTDVVAALLVDLSARRETEPA